MQCVSTALEVENFDFTRKTVFEFHAKFHHLDQRVVPETSKSHFSKPCRVEIGRRVEGGIRQSSPSCLLIYGVCCSLYSTLDLVYVLWRKGQKTTYCIILGFLQFAPRSSRPKSKLPDLQEYRRLMSDNIGSFQRRVNLFFTTIAIAPLVCATFQKLLLFCKVVKCAHYFRGLNI